MGIPTQRNVLHGLHNLKPNNYRMGKQIDPETGNFIIKIVEIVTTFFTTLFRKKRKTKEKKEGA